MLKIKNLPQVRLLISSNSYTRPPLLIAWVCRVHIYHLQKDHLGEKPIICEIPGIRWHWETKEDVRLKNFEFNMNSPDRQRWRSSGCNEEECPCWMALERWGQSVLHQESRLVSQLPIPRAGFYGPRRDACTNPNVRSWCVFEGRWSQCFVHRST